MFLICIFCFCGLALGSLGRIAVCMCYLYVCVCVCVCMCVCGVLYVETSPASRTCNCYSVKPLRRTVSDVGYSVCTVSVKCVRLLCVCCVSVYRTCFSV